MQLPGKISAYRILKLKFLGSGKIISLNANLGQTIKKGDLLAKLDPGEPQTYLDRALKYYEQVRAEFDEKQNKSLSEYDKRKIQAELEVSIKNVELAKINLEASGLYAPINGIIIDIDPIAVGLNISPSNFIITLLDHQSFYFQAEIPEDDLNIVKADMPVKVSLKAFSGKTFDGKVSWVSYFPEKEGIYNVHVALSDLSELKLGLSGTALI